VNRELRSDSPLIACFVIIMKIQEVGFADPLMDIVFLFVRGSPATHEIKVVRNDEKHRNLVPCILGS
jgi:hypothetical protein